MRNYDIKILLAFGEILGGNTAIFKWLLNNGYPEFCALHACLRHDRRAMEWLLKNNFPEFAAFARAIDEEKSAEEWLLKNDFQILFMLKEAAYHKEEAIQWFRKNNLEVYILLAAKLRAMKLQQHFDYNSYYKMNF